MKKDHVERGDRSEAVQILEPQSLFSSHLAIGSRRLQSRRFLRSGVHG
jgi:hypothetical protein